MMWILISDNIARKRETGLALVSVQEVPWNLLISYKGIFEPLMLKNICASKQSIQLYVSDSDQLSELKNFWIFVGNNGEHSLLCVLKAKIVES